MKPRVGIVHTFLYSVESIKEQFKKYLPDVEIINIVDDSLLEETLQNRGPTPGIISRMSDYFQNLQDLGCSVALNQCSSVGESADVAAEMCTMPILKIDGPMAKKAAELGNNIAVIATDISTMGPSSRLVEAKAKAMGKDVTVSRCYVDGAYEMLLKAGDRDAHDRMVIAKIEEAAKTHDVIVLAQGSMDRLVPMLSHITVPVLTSLETGVEQIKDFLKL